MDNHTHVLKNNTTTEADGHTHFIENDGSETTRMNGHKHKIIDGLLGPPIESVWPGDKTPLTTFATCDIIE